MKGKVFVTLNKGKQVDHIGVRIELIGQIEYLIDNKQNLTFLTLTKDLEPPGSLTDNMAYDFNFQKVEK